MLLFFGMRSSAPGERLLRPRSLSDLYSTPADIREQPVSHKESSRIHWCHLERRGPSLSWSCSIALAESSPEMVRGMFKREV